MSERERWWKDTISEVTIDVGRRDGRTDVGVRWVGASFQNKISFLHTRYKLWCMAKGFVTHLIGLEKIKQRGMQL